MRTATLLLLVQLFTSQAAASTFGQDLSDAFENEYRICVEEAEKYDRDTVMGACRAAKILEALVKLYAREMDYHEHGGINDHKPQTGR